MPSVTTFDDSPAAPIPVSGSTYFHGQPGVSTAVAVVYVDAPAAPIVAVSVAFSDVVPLAFPIANQGFDNSPAAPVGGSAPVVTPPVIAGMAFLDPDNGQAFTDSQGGQQFTDPGT